VIDIFWIVGDIPGRDEPGVTKPPDAANKECSLVGGNEEAELARLLKAALQGDERAYAEFLRKAAALVRGFARRRAGQGSIDPEDIVQETLLAIHLKRHTWQSDLPVEPWLYAIARFKLVDAFRKVGRRMEVVMDESFDPPAPEPEQSASEREIGRALDALAPGQRAVVSAISVEGRSIGEAARKLGMTEVAVRVSLHRGLAAIAKKFGRS
jgi:RNA polymerase sigma-70 factor (ECF subfamily)